MKELPLAGPPLRGRRARRRRGGPRHSSARAASSIRGALRRAARSVSSLASALKVNLPLATSGSTMSVSYAVDFASLLLLGADETMLVAAASAWSQCTFRTQARVAAPPDAVQHGVARADGEGDRAGVHAGSAARPPGAPFSLLGDSQAAGRRGHRLLHLQHAAHRDRDRPVDAAVDRARLERELPVERAELFRRRRRRGGRRVRSSTAAATGWRCWPPRRST